MQGEDWGWRREHSLKGLVRHSWPGGSLGKSGAAEEARDFFLPLCFLVREEERGLRAQLKRAPETGVSRGYQHGPRDGHETLRLLLQPPRSLCASTGHYPHLPSREPVQPATARLP